MTTQRLSTLSVHRQFATLLAVTAALGSVHCGASSDQAAPPRIELSSGGGGWAGVASSANGTIALADSPSTSANATTVAQAPNGGTSGAQSAASGGTVTSLEVAGASETSVAGQANAGSAPPRDDSSHPGIAVATPSEHFLVPELLARPTATSITLSLVPKQELDLFVEFGTSVGSGRQRTSIVRAAAEKPIEVTLESLAPDTEYHYRVQSSPSGASEFAAGPMRRFHTARAPGQSFVFTIQADPHLDANANLAEYQQSLLNQANEVPDFMLDLGDTFMSEKYPEPFTATVQTARDFATVLARYRFERGNFGLVAHSIPLFLVNGNHEGELGWLLDGTSNNVAVWTTLARKLYYPPPFPNGFFTGSEQEEPWVGRRGASYAWTWGDALFLVLDPFWYTTSRPKDDCWVWTLGAEQYRWLTETLTQGQTKYRFVFIHNLLGGLDSQARGGIETAPFCEWGGNNADNTWGFGNHRPGWNKPIHQLLVENHVSAVFHGHDHVYVHQELDGIAYQELPQPSVTNYSNGVELASTGLYATGTVISSSGYLRVRVTAASAEVEYVRTYRPEDENRERHNGDVADHYRLLPQ